MARYSKEILRCCSAYTCARASGHLGFVRRYDHPCQSLLVWLGFAKYSATSSRQSAASHRFTACDQDVLIETGGILVYGRVV